MHATMLYLPIGQRVLRTEPVGINLWGTLIGLSLTVLVAIEIHKWTWARRHGSLVRRGLHEFGTIR
jgi:hypothetical protein